MARISDYNELLIHVWSYLVPFPTCSYSCKNYVPMFKTNAYSVSDSPVTYRYALYRYALIWLIELIWLYINNYSTFTHKNRTIIKYFVIYSHLVLNNYTMMCIYKKCYQLMGTLSPRPPARASPLNPTGNFSPPDPMTCPPLIKIIQPPLGYVLPGDAVLLQLLKQQITDATATAAADNVCSSSDIIRQKYEW